MGKDPTIPFYASDFYMDTIQMDERLVGAYTKLLCVLWVNGFCHYDAISLARVSPSTKEVVDLIKDKFTFSEDGTFTSNRLEEERAKRLHNREVRSESGKLGAYGKWHGKKMAKEDEKEYEKEQEIDKELVDEIYKLYPSKCSNGRPTGKRQKDKEKIAKHLKAGIDLKALVELYIRKINPEYYQNFSTFLSGPCDQEELEKATDFKDQSKTKPEYKVVEL